MGNAAHIGRLGALAVALGIGSAIASMPCIAAAQPSESPSATSGASAGSHSGRPVAKPTAVKAKLTAVRPVHKVPVLSGAAKLPTPERALQDLASALEFVGSELERLGRGRPTGS